MKFGRALLRPFNFTIPRRVNGRHIRIPVLGGVKVGVLGEPFLLDILTHFLPMLDGAFVDVGANLGQTLCKVKLADPNRRYYGFEPNAACHAYLEALVRRNHWSDVSLFPCGLSDRTSMLPLHVPRKAPTDGRASLLPSARPELDIGTVKQAIFFSFPDVAHVVPERIAFLKIDVEGAELEVLRGMTDALRRHEPLVAFEMMSVPALVERHRRTVALLDSLGYDIASVVKNSDKRWAGFEPIAEYELDEAASRNDYIAIPRNRPWRLDGQQPSATQRPGRSI